MENEEKDVLSRHLRETKAKRRSTSLSEMARRVRLEQEFRKLLISLEEDDIEFREYLPSLVIDGEVKSTPDFIVYKNDMGIPIFLLPHKEGRKLRVPKDEVKTFFNFLKETNHELIVVVWMSQPTFPCVVLKLVDLAKILRKKRKWTPFDTASPFKERIIGIFSETPVWPIPKYEQLVEIEKPEFLLKTFESSFEKTMSREAKKRRPRLPHRKKALQLLTTNDLQRINLLFRRYFKREISEEDLMKTLRQFS